MSRAARRRGGREGPGQGGVNKTPIWIMSGSVVAALVVVALVAGPRSALSHHPAPRIDAHEMHVMPAARYANSPGVGEVYEMAAEMPEMMDGVYCYCLCRNTFGHYSLLDCFLTDHGAGCDICMQEAILTYQMTKQGDSLDDIRQEVDRRYRT
ncbi:MAG: PCYCGC domain-containing protein [Gemmatimonadota bacterium]|nr:PCYCGC domain-containing protein [Gemmatimonadota bacterium]MDH3421997.1 PCYCGC domain-containing protein [Gemmatimonadota bacterium]